jgi:hypothetical protein
MRCHETRKTNGARKTTVGVPCRRVSGNPVVETETLKDGTVAWVVTVSSEARGALKGHLIIGADGGEYAALSSSMSRQYEVELRLALSTVASKSRPKSIDSGRVPELVGRVALITPYRGQGPC